MAFKYASRNELQTENKQQTKLRITNSSRGRYVLIKIGGGMELILFRLFAFSSVLVLLVNLSLFSFYEFRSHEENKLYNSTESIRRENMAKQKSEPLCSKSEKQNGIYSSTLNNCEDLTRIEDSVDYGLYHLRVSK